MWKDIFKMMGFNVVDWIRLDEDMEQWRALMNTAMRRQVPWKAGNFLISWETFNLSRISGFILFYSEIKILYFILILI